VSLPTEPTLLLPTSTPYPTYVSLFASVSSAVRTLGVVGARSSYLGLDDG